MTDEASHIQKYPVEQPSGEVRAYYPGPKPLKAESPALYQRYRVVIPEASHDAAWNRAKQIARSGVSCDLEIFEAFVDDATKEQLGEMTLSRQLMPAVYQLPAEAAADAPE
jgi:hypothetical protein